MKGKVKFDYALEDGVIRQEFGIEIRHASANRDYQLMVDFGEGEIDLGTFSTDSLGHAGLEFDSTSGWNQTRTGDFLPAGRDVRNIRRVRILLEGTTVLEAGF